MDVNEYNNMSNSELQIVLETIENEFEAKKNSILSICDELEKLKLKYDRIIAEINSRKNAF